MRPYETLVIIRPDLGAEGPTLLDRFAGIIEGQGGSIDGRHDWGNRRLAYPIAKQTHGLYHLFEYQAEPGVVAELERNLRITEGVIRFLSVQQEHTGLPEERVPEPERGSRDVPLNEMRSYGGRGERSMDSSDARSQAASDGDNENFDGGSDE
jgi:small subunit ribosomal protein S6